MGTLWNEYYGKSEFKGIGSIIMKESSTSAGDCGEGRSLWSIALMGLIKDHYKAPSNVRSFISSKIYTKINNHNNNKRYCIEKQLR